MSANHPAAADAKFFFLLLILLLHQNWQFFIGIILAQADSDISFFFQQIDLCKKKKKDLIQTRSDFRKNEEEADLIQRGTLLSRLHLLLFSLTG